MRKLNTFSSCHRENIVRKITSKKLDVLVIGGGITGAGILLDATSRGLKTGLVEMQDYAAGTSSRSTKLIHGGLRYLKQFEAGLVAEVGKERAIVYENGPHVTTPEWMMLPFYKGGTFGVFTTNIGLRVYDFLAGVKKEERRKMLRPEEALQKEPLLAKEKLKGAGFYVEYKTDDARLTIEVMKKAVELGALALNYIKVIHFLYDDFRKINGVIVEDQISGEQFSIFAKKIINATGPWVDELRDLDGSKQGKTLHLTKGVHLVFSKQRFPLQQAIYFDAPDGRMIFAIPRKNKTYVGTTETDYEGNIARPLVTEEDRDYLLAAINFMFPTLNIESSDVESSWAGLRPLIAEEGKNPDEISRKDEIFISKSGLYSIAGGKLTGYRKMAEAVTDRIVEEFKVTEGILYSPSETRHLPISGGDIGGAKHFKDFKDCKLKEDLALGMDRQTLKNLIQTYGSNIDIIFQLYEDAKKVAQDDVMDPIVLATLKYAISYEQAYKPIDYFIRRTGALFFNIQWVEDHQHQVVDYMEKVLHWTEAQKHLYHEELKQMIEEAKQVT